MKKTLLFILLIPFNIANSQVIDLVAGNGYCCDPTDSLAATTASLYYPNGVAVDTAGNIFISEPNRIRKVHTSGLTTIYAGSYGGYSGDGGPAINAKLESEAVAVDGFGNVYSADWFNHYIRKINPAGIISTIAGNGIQGFSGDGGLAINASLNGPYGLALDPAGNLYIADTDNNRIRKISSSGIITTVAGNGPQGFSGDGGLATFATLYHPIGITFDAAGNLYIADHQNNRIRKVNTAGIISTIAGTGTLGSSGDGGPAIDAELNNPSGVACDHFGNVFIADVFNLRIRMINNMGVINTIAGAGTYGYSGDGGPAIAAEFKEPWGICTDFNGNVYIADIDNHRVRKISNITGIFEAARKNTIIKVYPNPTQGKFQVETNSSENILIQLFDLDGKLVFEKNVNNKTIIDATYLNDGIYNLSAKIGNEIINKKLVIIH